MDKEYISIREFAARANISRQGAYKIINKKLQNYCKIIENKKYIDISAVEKLQKAGDKSCQLGDKIVCGDCQLGDKNVALSLQQGCLSADNHTFQLGDKDCQLGDKDCQLGDKDCQLGDKSCLLGDKSCLLGDKTVDSCLQQGNQFVDNYKFQPGDRNCQLGDKSVDKMVDILNEQLKIKDKQIEAKDKQLETKDKQISELTEMLKDVQSKQNELMCSLKAAQALHAGTIQEHIDSKVEKESKKGFWHWLFKRRH